MSKFVALLYPMDSKRINKIKSLMLFMGVGVREVQPEEYEQAIGALAGTLSEGTMGEASAQREMTLEMMVLCMPQKQISQVVDRFRRHGQQLPHLTAALTDTNSAWSSYGLYEELLREREAFSSGSAPAHDENV